MDPYTSESPVTLAIARPQTVSSQADPPLTAEVRLHEPLRFPAEDGGRSLNDMAERDLDAALQLLAERAQYITGASGAAIALGDVQQMVCRASSGPCAPKVGSSLQADSGLSGESARTRQILCCNNAAEDARVDRESCRALGIAAAMVMPLQRNEEVVGIFEIFSSRAHAFEERDLIALQRLGEMILTAIEHAEAAHDAHSLIAAAGISTSVRDAAGDPLAEAISSPTQAPLVRELGNIGQCRACGFPVSEGRTFCVDCENSSKRGTSQASQSSGAAQSGESSWLQSHKYLVGTVVVAAIAATALIFLR
jgi:hypothetical protein